MRKAGLSAALLTGVFLAASNPGASACGDKFLVIGRGARRVPRAHHPAAIVLYLRPGSSLPDAARQSKLEANLRQAGHQVDRVEGSAGLTLALAARRHDFVIADFSDLPSLTTELKAATGAPDVVPVAYTASDADAATSQFVLVIRMPIHGMAYLSALDDANGRRTKAAPRR